MGRKRNRQPKTKSCFACHRETEIAYRIRHDTSKKWDFVCPDCIMKYKTDNPHYVYGGTWKGSRH